MTEHSLADEIERLVKRLASPDTTTDITQAAADIGWLVTSWASTILLALRAPRPAEPEAAEAERVARAIYEYQPPNIPRPSIPTWGEATTERQELFRGFARAALAALRPADSGPGVEAWQPIETAPRDGTTIVMWDGDGGLRDRVVVGAYDALAKHPWRFLDNPFRLTGVEHDGDGMCNAFLGEPTHWRPLPAVPGALPQPASPQAE